MGGAEADRTQPFCFPSLVTQFPLPRNSVLLTLNSDVHVTRGLGHPVESFSWQAVVGFCALASGIFGVTGLGMGLMAGTVTVGVLKGELDPSAKVA